MKVNIKKLNKDAVIPIKAHPTDAGFDLTAISIEYDYAHNCITYGTGLAVEIPEGYMGLLFPRSSIYKTKLDLCNSVGLVDSSYRGEIKAKFYYDTLDDIHNFYKVGDRVCQLVIVPYPEIEFNEVDELSDSDRGLGGFGSSGN